MDVNDNPPGGKRPPGVLVAYAFRATLWAAGLGALWSLGYSQDSTPFLVMATVLSLPTWLFYYPIAFMVEFIIPGDGTSSASIESVVAFGAICISQGMIFEALRVALSAVLRNQRLRQRT